MKNGLILAVSVLLFIAAIYCFIDSLEDEPLKIEYIIIQEDKSLPVDFLIGKGDSMLPLFKDGDTVYYQKIPYNRLQKGMVVIFSTDGWKLVCHSIVEEKNGKWLTKGINNIDIDKDYSLNEKNYIGVVVRK
jgi:signal peptidase I